MEALLGVIIGGIITIIGNIINNHYSLKKQKEQFNREKVANKEEWLRIETKAESENIREIYRNAFSAISSFIAEVNQEGNIEGLNKGSKSPKVEEILDWFAILALRFPDDSDLTEKIEAFSNLPVEYNAIDLRDKIKELIQRETNFFLQNPKDATPKNKEVKERKIRTLQFKIDDNYRKEQLIKGIEINQSQQREIELKDFTESQRKIITDIHFKNTKNIPSRIILYRPVFNESKGHIELKGEQWKCRLNPNDVSLTEILTSWEDDYLEAYEHAKSQLND